MVAERYIKNIGWISEEDQANLLTKSIAVIGCGGNGGYILESLARLGVKRLVFFDGDNFELSNINRQRFMQSDEHDKGCYKAALTEYYLHSINPTIMLQPYCFHFKPEHINLIEDCDMIVLAFDNSTNEIKAIRESLIPLIQKGIPIIDQACDDQGAWVHIVTARSLELYARDTAGWNLVNPKISRGYQPGYLCMIAAAMTVSEIQKYFAMSRSPALGQKIVWNIHTMEMHRLDADYGWLY